MDDLRFLYLDEMHKSPKVGEIVTFLSSGLELPTESIRHSIQIIVLVFGVCGAGVAQTVVEFTWSRCHGVDLADVIEPVQSFLLNTSS